ncbi:MAG: sigma-70 family RNA polymerase sigma factor [Bacteroidales bacterium]|nr:sigma-70 family RNA polymerase sigma factor [Bacteroidales bacterium]
MANWTDKDMVIAVQQHNNAALECYYHDCKNYFQHHAGAVFVGDANVEDIFHDALIHLWREIETRRIELSDGRVCRWREGTLMPMTSSLLTFLLSIAKRKHWEMVRKQQKLVFENTDSTLEALDCHRYSVSPENVEQNELRERVVADIVLQMSERCRQILTLFYYEHRSLDDILALRSENQSKQGLKTSKYKCMQRLREAVCQRFRQLDIMI